MSTDGFVSEDGSPLPIYLALPAGEGPSIIETAVPPRSSILELGSGPGRVTRVLVALGHHVVAVDDSEEMLDHVTGAETVCTDLWTLDLGRRFDAVVAGSHLLNRPGAASRRRLLEVARGHLVAGGSLLIERSPPGWLQSAEDTDSSAGPVGLRLEVGPLRGAVRSATMTYSLGSRTWRQTFEAEDVTDETLSAEADAAGFTSLEALDDAGAWVRLVAV